MGVIDVKNVRYSYGKFIVTGGSGTGSLSPEEMERLERKIEQEVAIQMNVHDKEVKDTHHIDAEDTQEYPDVTIFDDDNT